MISRQRRWQLKKKAEGLCIRCAFHKIYKGNLCLNCYTKAAIKQRVTQRNRLGQHEWVFGKRGRPPILEIRMNRRVGP